MALDVLEGSLQRGWDWEGKDGKQKPYGGILSVIFGFRTAFPPFVLEIKFF